MPAQDINLAATYLPLAALFVHPLLILALCVVAGVGTVLMLPGRREAAVRGIGGVVLLAAGLVGMAVLLRQAGITSGADVYFWIFSAVAIFGAVRVITHTRPIYSALYFVLTVVASAGLFVLLWAEFMATALILIYAGAILVTYVFVIMLAHQAVGQGAEYDRVAREPVAATAVGFVLLGVMLFLIFDKAPQGTQIPPKTLPLATRMQPLTPPTGPEAAPVQALGEYLFTEQAVTFEVAGLLLAVGMVGAVVIARKQVRTGPEVLTVSEAPAEVVSSIDAPPSDDPHSIPVYGTTNPAAKSYPEA